MRGISNRSIVVTGGSRGIGRSIARDLAARGADLGISYLDHRDEAEDLAGQLREEHDVVVEHESMNLKEKDSVKSFFKGMNERLDGVDGLVNNAGIVSPMPFPMMSDEAWEDVVGTNLNGTFYLTRIAVQYFLKQGAGDIVNVSSLTGLHGRPGQSNYGASKAGIIGMTRSVAKEIASEGLRINAVAPGLVETDMIEDIPEEDMEEYREEIPMNRIGKPEEVAGTVSFLLSEEAGYVNGETIVIDGALSA